MDVDRKTKSPAKAAAPILPDVFNDLTFHVHPSTPDCELLSRYIIAYGGTIESPSADTTHVITLPEYLKVCFYLGMLDRRVSLTAPLIYRNVMSFLKIAHTCVLLLITGLGTVLILKR